MAAVSKVVYGENTLIDLTGDTVTADVLLEGYTAHDAAGNPITGTAATTVYVADSVLYLPFGSVSGNTLEV